MTARRGVRIFVIFGALGASLALLLAVLGLAVPCPVAAQDIMTPGDAVARRVRVHFCAHRPGIEGTITAVDPGALSLRDADAALSVPLQDIRQLDVRWKDRGRWATIGLFVGAFAAYTGTRIISNRRYGGNDYGAGLIGLFVIAPIGGLIGAPAGAILAPETWQPVPPEAIGIAGPARCR